MRLRFLSLLNFKRGVFMTLKDIADKAGVSMMTVSNVINGKHNRVSAKTIEKVNQIIKEYNYVPNLSARSLTNKSSNIIAIVISTKSAGEDNSDVLQNPYVSTMLGTIESELRSHGYYTMLRSIDDINELDQLLKNWNIDGILFLFPDFETKMTEFSKKTQCPIAVFDSVLESDNIINVCSDDEKGLYLSTKYVINHGHTHIGFVADYEGNPLLTKRLNGYRRALEESGIPFRPEYVFEYSPTYEGGVEAGKKIAGSFNYLTAVVTSADICAIGIMEGARLGGLRIPIDLSITGYDNLQICQFTSPKLTSISQDIHKKALTATQMLLEKIQTGTLSGPSTVVMDVEVAERQSVISLF